MLVATLVLSLSLSATRAQDLPPPPPPPSFDALTDVPPPSPGVEVASVTVPAAPPVAAAAPIVAAPPSRAFPRLGMQVDLGVPQGLVAALAFRPIPSLRLWGGPAWNYIAWGGQLGAALTPFHWGVTPALSVEAGRYLSADLSWLAKEDGGVPAELEPLLRDVAYSYASVLLGLELGNPRGFAVSLRAGLTHLRVAARGTAGSAASPDGGASGEAQVSFRDPDLRATVPTTKLGLQFWF